MNTLLVVTAPFVQAAVFETIAKLESSMQQRATRLRPEQTEPPQARDLATETSPQGEWSESNPN